MKERGSGDSNDYKEPYFISEEKCRRYEQLGFGSGAKEEKDGSEHMRNG